MESFFNATCRGNPESHSRPLSRSSFILLRSSSSYPQRPSPSKARATGTDMYLETNLHRTQRCTCLGPSTQYQYVVVIIFGDETCGQRLHTRLFGAVSTYEPNSTLYMASNLCKYGSIHSTLRLPSTMAHIVLYPGKDFFYAIGNTSAVVLTDTLAPRNQRTS